jgi:hypothetical protein
MAPRELHLNMNILNAGFHGAARRAPSSDPTAFVDVQHYVRAAKIAERGTFGVYASKILHTPVGGPDGLRGLFRATERHHQHR